MVKEEKYPLAKKIKIKEQVKYLYTELISVQNYYQAMFEELD
jgi:hypothetical protein